MPQKAHTGLRARPPPPPPRSQPDPAIFFQFPHNQALPPISYTECEENPRAEASGMAGVVSGGGENCAMSSPSSGISQASVLP